MASMTPYFGSKISLISKSDIRYEGYLYAIDTEKSTVTLSRVGSFGTENRPTNKPVAKTNEIYNFIVFRGFDIKDLHVAEPPKAPSPPATSTLPQDPAILQHSGTTTTTSVSSGLPPALPPVPYGSHYGPLGHHPFGPMVPPHFAAPPGPPGAGLQGFGGRSSPPLPRRSPTMEQAVQASGPDSPEKQGTSEGGRSDDSKEGDKRTRSNQKRKSSREDRERQGERSYNRQMSRDSQRSRDIRENTDSRDTRDSRDGRDGRDGRDNRDNRDDRDGRDNRDREGNYRDYRRNNNDRQSNRGQPRRSRGGRGYGRRGGGARDIAVGNDFDFDNAQLDKKALEDEFQKMKIVNGETKKEDDSGNETQPSELPEEDPESYDPEKSFFDNISCESTSGRERNNWRQERKMNVETFGVSSSRGRGRGRGGYRGYRGGYNGGYRGGYRGGYNNYRDNRSYYGGMSRGGQRNMGSSSRNWRSGGYGNTDLKRDKTGIKEEGTVEA